MRNKTQDILINIVETLKRASKLVGYDLIFLEKDPKQITTYDGWETRTVDMDKEFVTKIFLFRDFKLHYAISSQSDIRKFLPFLYSNSAELKIKNKHYIFQIFGYSGIFCFNQELPSDLPDYENDGDVWCWQPPIIKSLNSSLTLMLHNRRCPNCNYYFFVNHPLQRYCDGSCRRMMYVKHRKQKLLEEMGQKKIIEVNCKYCGGIFETHKYTAKYCGIRCRMAAYRKRKITE
jgi:ribosomal protein S27AE